MLKNLQGARLGVFVFLGTALLVLSIFLIGNKESLFVSTITVNTYFDRIEGLKTGAPVRLSGYDVGSVGNISLAGDTTGRVIVKMKINKDYIHFIRLDSEASIETEGLVGKKIVAVTPGSQSSELITDNGFIKAKNPINIGEIITETQSVMANLKDLTKDFSEIFAKINQGNGTLGKLVNDEQLYYAAVNVTKSADQNFNSITKRMNDISDLVVSMGGNVKNILGNVDSTVIDLKHIISNVDKGEGILGAFVSKGPAYDSVKTVINNLVSTSENAAIGTARFAENMEALKHNWLFKGYFEQRGYWDTSDYEKTLDSKIAELKLQTQALDYRINELRELQEKLEKLKDTSNK